MMQSFQSTKSVMTMFGPSCDPSISLIHSIMASLHLMTSLDLREEKRWRLMKESLGVRTPWVTKNRSGSRFDKFAERKDFKKSTLVVFAHGLGNSSGGQTISGHSWYNGLSSWYNGHSWHNGLSSWYNGRFLTQRTFPLDTMEIWTGTMEIWMGRKGWLGTVGETSIQESELETPVGMEATLIRKWIWFDSTDEPVDGCLCPESVGCEQWSLLEGDHPKNGSFRHTYRWFWDQRGHEQRTDLPPHWQY